MKEVIEHMQSEFENILLDTQKEYRRSNRMKDKIIVVLIVLMFLEAIIGYCGFVWYESQFDYVTTEQTTQDIDLSTEETTQVQNIMMYRGINIMIMQHTMNSKGGAYYAF